MAKGVPYNIKQSIRHLSGVCFYAREHHLLRGGGLAEGKIEFRSSNWPSELDGYRIALIDVQVSGSCC